MADSKQYIDTVAAAAFFGVSRRSLERWRVQGVGPSYVKFGRAVRYAVADLEAFANAGRVAVAAPRKAMEARGLDVDGQATA